MHMMLPLQQSPCLPHVQSCQRHAILLVCNSSIKMFFTSLALREGKKVTGGFRPRYNWPLMSCFMVNIAGEQSFEPSVDMQLM